jgi:ATP-binding cassette subfamily B protein
VKHGLARLRTYGFPYRRVLIFGALLTLVDVALSLAVPWPLRVIVDGIITPASKGRPVDAVPLRLGLCIGALVGLVMFGSIANYWALRLLGSTGLRIANDLRVTVLSRLQRQSLRFHRSHRVGDLTARVTSDVNATQDMLVQILSTLLPNALLVVGMFAVMLWVDPVFTALALLAAPPLIFATHRSRMRLRTAARQVRKAEGIVASAATEDLSSIHLVQVFTLENERLNRFSGLSGASLTAGLDAVRIQAKFMPLVDLASVISTAVVLWFGAFRVLEGKLSLGVLLVFITYLGSLYKPIKSLSKLSTVVSKGAAAAERIEDVLDAPLDIVDDPQARPKRIRGEVEFRNVTFSYGREPVLDNLSLRMEPGEHLALVGPTGAGKSTVAALIPRLIDVDHGQVLIDGVDVRRHQLSSLRGQIATVLQDTVLLDGTLRENIICGQPRVTGHAVARAARLALVNEFADRLPDGLDTQVGERGVSLSGGQRQRVAIARAILRDAPILILDEPTSALDAGSEELLLEALDNLPSGRTRLVIAHRLSTVRAADRILVLQQGRIREAGSHSELMSNEGMYSELVRIQDGHRRLPTEVLSPR